MVEIMCDSHDHAIHEVTGAEEELAQLRERVARLEAALLVERAVSEVVAEGNTTIAAITAALRRRGNALLKKPAHQLLPEARDARTLRTWLAHELLSVAAEIEQESKTERETR